MIQVRDVAFNTSLIQGIWWEGLFKQHLGRKGFLFSHCHEGSLIWRKHTRITMRQERSEVTTQPPGYKQEFCRVTVRENQHKSNNQQCCFPTTWNHDLPRDVHFLTLIFIIYSPTFIQRIKKNMQTVGRVMIILPIARLRHAEVKGRWFSRSSIDLVLSPQHPLPPFRLAGDTKASRGTISLISLIRAPSKRSPEIPH